MAITAAMVKELRELTGAGMMDCKKALGETDGNMDEAVEYLRKNGQAKAENKAGRIAAEGLCTVAVSYTQLDVYKRQMDMSALKEIGNIIAGSYLNALSAMTQLTIAPSVPYIAIDMAGAILSVPAIQFGKIGDNALMITTEFGDEVMIEGYFILLPDLESYEKILKSLGITL